MRKLRVILVLLLASTTACTKVGDAWTTRDAEQHPDNERGSYAATDSGDCQSFEVLDFGAFEARALRGNAWSGSEPAQPLSGVLVVARATETGEIHSAVTSSDGSFDLQGIDGGEYAVSACLDGFDELQFRVTIEEEKSVEHFELFLGASEALGRRDVVPVEVPLDS